MVERFFHRRSCRIPNPIMQLLLFEKGVRMMMKKKKILATVDGVSRRTDESPGFRGSQHSGGGVEEFRWDHIFNRQLP